VSAGFNPHPSTLNPQPSTLNPQTSNLNPPISRIPDLYGPIPDLYPKFNLEPRSTRWTAFVKRCKSDPAKGVEMQGMIGKCLDPTAQNTSPCSLNSTLNSNYTQKPNPQAPYPKP
jgi:hypothetical protein